MKRNFFIFLFVAFHVSHSFYGESKVYRPLLPVPIIRQANPYSCGAASLLGVLSFWNVYSHGEVTLYKEVGTTEEGTKPEKIVEVAKKMGLKAEMVLNTPIDDVLRALHRGEPVIVDFQAWSSNTNPDYRNIWDSGHYAVAIGFDESHIYFMDPVLTTGYGKLTLTEFLNRWHDEDLIEGKVVKHLHLAIFIKGETPLRTFPEGVKGIE